MKILKTTFGVLTAHFAALSFSCAPKVRSTGIRKNSADGKTLKFAFAANNSADFRIIARKGVEKADAGQKRIVENLISTGVNGTAISPVDPFNRTQLIKEAATKSLVITRDANAPPGTKVGLTAFGSKKR